MAVFAWHCSLILVHGAVWFPGHAAVIVFFVLSGYVIAFVTQRNEGKTLRAYALARLSRLYSVVLPALGLTALTVVVGKELLHLPLYDDLVREHEVVRYLATAFFLQSVWWTNLAPAENSPFWSLGYEAWYYVIWGGLIFLPRPGQKAIFVLACALMVGPNVMILWPVWILGAGLYFYGRESIMSLRLARAAFFWGAGVVLTAVFFLPEMPGKVGFAPWFYSASFLSDTLLALSVSAMIWLFGQGWGHTSVSPSFEKFIRWPARRSFSLYLFHQPLLYFIHALGIFNPAIVWQAVVEITLVLGVIGFLSEITEVRRKTLYDWMARVWT